MTPGAKRLTASEVIILAASDLSATRDGEFTEWQLSVAAWKRDPNRFGMRGFEAAHPDHKRVMKEIMGKTGAVHKGLLEKARPNHYSLSPLGRSEAARLSAMAGSGEGQMRSVSDLYDDLAEFTEHRVFRAWTRNPSEPSSWLGASAFLGLANHEPNELNSKLRTPKHLAREGLAWCDKQGRDQITRGPVGGGKAITRAELLKLSEFVEVLQTRFARQISAIQGRGEQPDPA